VLWIPVEGSRDIPLAERRVATAFIWSPNQEEESLLRQDWEELMEMVALGQIESITAHHGEVLQLRPKAANGQAMTQAIGRDGTLIQTRPRGFYLRSRFTWHLLKKAFS
jgi:DNA mismatch repair protein MutH